LMRAMIFLPIQLVTASESKPGAAYIPLSSSTTSQGRL
jgi:hypothetical protein